MTSIYSNSMPAIKDVHRWSFPKHKNALKRLINSMTDKLCATGLSYTRLFENGQVIDLPILECELHGVWLEGNPNQDPAFLLNNVTKIPKMMWYHELGSFLCTEDQSNYAFIENMRPFDPCLSYIKYNKDNSISRLSVITSCPILGFFSDKHHVLDQCITSIQSYLFDPATRFAQEFDISNDITPIVFKGVKDSVTLDVLSQFTTQELACFKLIYTGHYESKEIASKLQKSPRTIEGIIARLLHKLNCNNKYELAVKISKMHDVMRFMLIRISATT